MKKREEYIGDTYGHGREVIKQAKTYHVCPPPPSLHPWGGGITFTGALYVWDGTWELLPSAHNNQCLADTNEKQQTPHRFPSERGREREKDTESTKKRRDRGKKSEGRKSRGIMCVKVAARYLLPALQHPFLSLSRFLLRFFFFLSVSPYLLYVSTHAHTEKVKQNLQLVVHSNRTLRTKQLP